MPASHPKTSALQTCTKVDCMGNCSFDRKLTMTQKANGGTDLLIEKFSRFEAAPNQPKWLAPLRKAGMAGFAELGFPKLSDEDWRFTNVAPIANLPFQFAREAVVNGAETKALDEAAFTKLSGHRLVFVNG